MKKTKKALLAALACSVVLAGALGVAACNNGGDDEGHSHSWGNWTVTTAPTQSSTGKATRTCANSGCDAAAEDKEVTLPALTDEVYGTPVTKTEATCTTKEVLTYTYNQEGVNVSFDVETATNPDAHKYNYVSTGADKHQGVCDYNDAHTVEEDHDTKGAGESCSVCGNITLDKEIPVTGASSSAVKRYFITLEAGDYQVVVDGNPIDTGVEVSVGTLVGDKFTEILSEGYDRLITVEGGTYCIEVTRNVTFKVRVAAEHQHAFDEQSWDYDKESHWHPAICGHDEIKTNGYAAHHWGTESAADADGITRKTCTDCSYVAYNYNGTALSGSGNLTVEQNGNYTATIVAEDWYGVCQVVKQTYNLQNGDTAKKYTFKILSNQTSINANGKTIEAKGDTVSVVLEANQSVNFTVGTDKNMVEDENYSVDVAFRVIVEEAPAAGDVLRPIIVNAEGEFGKDSVAANEEVHFTLAGSYGKAFYNQDVKLTFGEGVKVFKIGNNKNDAPVEISSGDYVTVGWGDYYLYAVSTDSACKVNFEIFIAPGKKDNPLTLNAGENNGKQGDMWYVFTPETAGKYVIKLNTTYASINVYNDVNGSLVESNYGPVVMELTAGTPVYFNVYYNYEDALKINIAEFTDADKGFVKSEPAELTAGNLEVHNGEYYYVFTPEDSCELTFTYKNGDSGDYSDMVTFWQYGDGNYQSYKTSGRNSLKLKLLGGETYYFKATTENASGTFKLDCVNYVKHNYDVTVTDGTNPIDNATVKLVYTVVEGGVNVEKTVEAASHAAGVYTFEEVDPYYNYRVVVEGLGNNDYYTGEASIASNHDTTKTAFTLNVYAKQEYKVKVALPAGVELPSGASLEGLKVSLSLSGNSVGGGEEVGPGGRAAGEGGDTATVTLSAYEALTDANGFATFKVLDPMAFNDGNKVPSSYVVKVSVPEGHLLENKFAYIEAAGNAVTVSADERDITAKPIVLTQLFAYTVSLVDGDGAKLEDGTRVTINHNVYTVSNGTVTYVSKGGITAIAIAVEGYSLSGNPVIDNENHTISATFALNDFNLKLDVPKSFENVTYNDAAIFELTVEEDGFYNFAFSNLSAWVVVYSGDYDQVWDDGEGFYLTAGVTYTVEITSENYFGDPISGTVTVSKA